MSVILGYGGDFVEVCEIDDAAGAVKKVVSIPVAVFDNMVRDYLTNRREGYVQARLLEGSLFDDDHFQV